MDKNVEEESGEPKSQSAPPPGDLYKPESLQRALSQFENTEIAFAHKSDVEMIKSFVLFRTMNNRSISRIGSTLTDIALTLKLPISGLVKHTLFEQFCGGETLEECRKTMVYLAKYNVKAILDYSSERKESEKGLDDAAEKVIDTLKEAKKDLNIPFIVFKPSGIARFKLLEKVSRNAPLNKDEQAEYARARDRVEYICKAAHDAFIPVMIDAEESWIQPCIDDLATEMMEKYNRRSSVVYNTFQMYRKGCLEFLKESYRRAERSGYMLGVKLVRGAYMEKERERAAEKRYPSPIHSTIQDTDRDYNEALEFCAEHIDRIALCAGTHNEESAARLVLLMEHYEIKKKNAHVYFSQLYGMGDHLSFNLAHTGYNVAKYTPYGPLAAVLPYLFRRADENASAMGLASREYCLIEKELKRRGI